MSKIAIVSDSSTILNSIQAKLVLLREDDSIIKCDSSEVFKGAAGADIILYHASQINDITLTTISNIKKSSNAVILLVDEINPKSILSAYDLGVSDFCGTNVTNFELLIKIINAKKALKQQKAIERLKSQLRDKGVLKPAADVYTQISDVINANFYSEIINSTIRAINAENKFSQVLRDSDFIINYAGFKYLIILPNTPLENAPKVFEKLKGNYDMKYVTFTYKDESPKELRSKIERLEIQSNDYPEEEDNDWLSDELTEEEPRNYKLFQNIFNKKIESAIEPAFYRTKQKYEKSFQNTKIKYFTDKNRAEFMLINFDKTNSLQIIYKNSAKVGINMQYSGLDAPENETFEVPLSKLNTRNLTEILETFIHKGEN